MGVGAVAVGAAVALVAGCSPLAQPLKADTCVVGDPACDVLANDHVELGCATQPTVSFVAISETSTDEEIQKGTQLAAGVMAAGRVPNWIYSVSAPVSGGRLGHLISVTIPAPKPIWSAPDLPPAPNSSLESQRERAMDALGLARQTACETSKARAIETGARQISEARAVLNSASAIRKVPKNSITLAPTLAQADGFFALHPHGVHEGVISVSLDLELPPAGFTPALEGSNWVVVTRGTTNPGRDRLVKKRLKGLLQSTGARRVVFVDRNFASPAQIVTALRPQDEPTASKEP